MQVLFSLAAGDRVHQDREAACACGHHRNALGGAAGPPDRRGIRTGLRSERVVRRGGAQGNAAEVIDKVNNEINTVLADPAMKVRLAEDVGGIAAYGLAG